MPESDTDLTVCTDDITAENVEMSLPQS